MNANAQYYFKNFRVIELIPGKAYKVGWLGADTRKYDVCVFHRVTEKGYAFITEEGERKHKGLLYPDKYSDAKKPALPFRIFKNITIRPYETITTMDNEPVSGGSIRFR